MYCYGLATLAAGSLLGAQAPAQTPKPQKCAGAAGELRRRGLRRLRPGAGGGPLGGRLRQEPGEGGLPAAGGRPAGEIETFERRADAPASIAVFQDLLGSMENGGKLGPEPGGGALLPRQGAPGDEFALATFASGNTQVEVPFTANLATLRESVGLWRAGGTTASTTRCRSCPRSPRRGTTRNGSRSL